MSDHRDDDLWIEIKNNIRLPGQLCEHQWVSRFPYGIIGEPEFGYVDFNLSAFVRAEIEKSKDRGTT